MKLNYSYSYINVTFNFILPTTIIFSITTFHYHSLETHPKSHQTAYAAYSGNHMWGCVSCSMVGTGRVGSLPRVGSTAVDLPQADNCLVLRKEDRVHPRMDSLHKPH